MTPHPTTLQPASDSAAQDQAIADTVRRERARLNGFIKRRVSDQTDADDILQDVFHEFVQACRLPEPIEQVSAWLFRVARNRIIDRFRKKREVALDDGADEQDCHLELMLPSADDPEQAYQRAMLLAALQLALEQLPEPQRAVFIAHELEGMSFKQIAASTGVALNTLLSRKRYAVLHLRACLQDFYDE